MVKKSEKKAGKAAEKVAQTKILNLLSFTTAVKAINGLILALKKELSAWVLEGPTGTTDKNYPYRQAGKVAGVLIQDNPQHEIDINALIGKIGLINVVAFLSIKRTALVEAIKAGKISGITQQELAEITRTTTGEPKVIPYYGSLDMAQVLSTEEE